MTHDFCFVHPSDYPDRFFSLFLFSILFIHPHLSRYILQKKNFKFGQYNVLPSTRRYWRTIESSTGIFPFFFPTLLLVISHVTLHIPLSFIFNSPNSIHFFFFCPKQTNKQTNKQNSHLCSQNENHPLFRKIPP